MGLKTIVSTKELIKLASQRVKLPNRKPIIVRYDEAVDALYLKYLNVDSVISKSKDTDGIIYDFDAEDNLVSIEILDLYDIFAQ